MKWILILVITTFYGETETQIISLDCPEGWIDYQTSCYLFSDESLVFDEADAACWSHGAKLLSVETYQEHKFISDWLISTDELARNTYYITSGKHVGLSHPFQNRIYWDGVRERYEGESFWFSEPPNNDRVYRIAYMFAGDGYKWTNISSNIPGGYICEVPNSELQDPAILERDYKYGYGSLNPDNVEQGPVIRQQPESVIVFDTVTTVSIECVASAIPAPTFTFWKGKSFQNATQVFSSKRYSISGGKLTITNPIEREDESFYFVIVTNKIGSVISEMAEIIFGYLGNFPNIELEPVVATAFTGAKLECNEPSFSPRVTFHWFENTAAGIHIWEDAAVINFFPSYTGILYISEVQPTDAEKKFYCVVSLTHSQSAKLGEGLVPSRTSLGQWLELSDKHATSDNDYPPFIHTHVFPSNPMVGKRVRMECVAYGRLQLHYTWYREDGLPFAPGTNISDSNRVLVIEKAPLSAEGNYICKCTSGFGKTSSKKIVLIMNAKPYFPYQIKDMKADSGMMLKWYCKAVGRPEPYYTWYKNGRRLHAHNGTHIHIDGGVLTFLKIDSERDTGMYQCAATNAFGTTFSSGQLTVLSIKPNFDRYPLKGTTYASIGSNVTIPCHFEAAPVPDVKWLKNGVNMHLVRGELIAGVGMNILYGLAIEYVEHSDAAVYTCHTTNMYGDATDSTRLIVADGLFLSRPPVPTLALVNTTAFIPCEAAYSELYDIVYIWRFNGKNIDTRLSRDYVKGRNSNVNGLYIRSVNYKHAGTYECRAQTPIHAISKSATLSVDGPPAAPAGVYVDANSITSRSVLVIWTPVELNLRAIATAYDIEADTTFHPDKWMIVAKDIPDNIATEEALKIGARKDQRAYTVNFLIPNTSYRFRVKAVNQFGRGQESSVPSAIVKLSASAPVKAPERVGGGGGSVGTLVINWKTIDVSEYSGPGIGYFVYWKDTRDRKDWRREVGNSGMAVEQGKMVITVGLSNYYLPYQVKVAAFNDLGIGPNSTEATVYSAEGMPVAVPKALKPTKINGTSIIVRWEPVPDTREAVFGRVRGYRVYYYGNKYGESAFEKEPDPTINEILAKDVYGQTDHCQLVGLHMSTEYFSRVQVFNGAGFGPKGEWRRSETARDMLRERPLVVSVYPHTKNSIIVRWRGITKLRYSEAQLQGYKIRVWKLQEDIRTAVDTVVDKVQEAIVNGLQTSEIYVVRVLGFSTAGDGALSEAVYFTLIDNQMIKFPMDPTTSQLCFLSDHARTCSSAAIRIQPTKITNVVFIFVLFTISLICDRITFNS